MRRLALTLVLALAPVAALAATMGVPLNQATVVTLSGKAHDVIVGNPGVADVTVPDPRHIVLVGKQGGVTNVIVMDAAGRTIFDREVVVGAMAGDRVTLINGPAVQSYACAPTCSQVAGASGGGAGFGGLMGGLFGGLSASASSGGIQASPTTP